MTVAATAAALAVLARLRREDPAAAFVLVLGAGCCEGTAPHLFRDYVLTPEHTRLGEVAGVPVYADAHVARLYAARALTLDAEADPTADGFSAETAIGWRFVLRA